MDKYKLDRYKRLVIGKMKNYRLSNGYKEFIELVGNQYEDDYIERVDLWVIKNNVKNIFQHFIVHAKQY